jgi:hypothetical protein
MPLSAAEKNGSPKILVAGSVMTTATDLLRCDILRRAGARDWSVIASGGVARTNGFARELPLANRDAAVETLSIGPTIRSGTARNSTCRGNASGIFLL